MINGQTTARNQIEGQKGCSELAARLELGPTPIVLDVREENILPGMSEWTGPIEK
ncbi:MAG TPA: hypothetical protein VNT01_05250 [Symbiobacteriaceae bacterium]|nr:hypothetical protein [Symbiobacteriaceae bacterium]